MDDLVSRKEASECVTVGAKPTTIRGRIAALESRSADYQPGCMLTMFGECSYRKTGCSDCTIKMNIIKALKQYAECENTNRISINIPAEFAADWKADRFEDALRRLSADAHCVAGQYEKETAEMLIRAFKNAKAEVK